MRRYRTVGAVSVVLILSILNAGQASAVEGIETDRVSSTLAPGLRLTEFDRFDSQGWIRGDVLTADLAEPALRPEYLSPESVSERTPLSEQVARSQAVAGVNGDFFDIDVTNAPLGVGIADGEPRQVPAAGHNDAVSVGEQAGRLMQIFLDAKLTRENGSTARVSDLNTAEVSPGGIALYTPLWGDASRASAVDGARRVTEVEVTRGVVTRISDAPAEGPVRPDAVRLLGVDAGADLLRSMRQGEHVGVDYRPRMDGPTPHVAIGGDTVLLRDGKVQPVDDTEVHPRTAVGFSADGRRMWLVTIDGRQANSRGMTELELAEELKSLGADDALNLDGGGSSTLLAREQGAGSAEVHNSPSDGEQRLVPNGIGLSTAPGSGRLTGFRVEPAKDSPQSERVLSGLTRRLTAFGHDEMGNPVAADPHWSAWPPDSGRMEGAGTQGVVFRGGQPGSSQVIAGKGSVSGRTTMSVLGPLTRLSTNVEQLSLPGEGAHGRFQVLGHDADGFRTWVEPADVDLEYDPQLLRITPDGDGFAVTALTEGASPVTAKVGDQVTHFGVTAGSQPQRLSGLDGVAGWRASAVPAPVRATLATAEGREGGNGLALDYALTGTNETRAAYVNSNPMLRLPAGTQRLGAWVKGDGNGGWLRSTIVDSAGVSTTVDLARKVDWTGWRYVEAPIPADVAGPLQLQRLYVVEPDAAAQYEGRLVFDDLTVSVAPQADVPVDPAPEDSSVVRDGTLPPGTGSGRVAVVSDAQFTADHPNGPLVQQARRSLREALAARPDMVVLNGDFVDRGTAADFDLAREVIDSELGKKVPWVYVPGNHETYGPGDLREFKAEFGRTYRVVDSGANRFVFLNSAQGTLREGGFQQVRMLRNALDTASTDPSVRSVSVFLHHPTEDPAPADASELTDPLEVDLLRDWLTDFERESGKPAVAVAAHAGAFHAGTVDGVPYLVNGNAGKSPALAPDNGGFTGSSMLRIDPEGGANPIRWQTRPHVDELRLYTPKPVGAGEQRPIRAELLQGDRVVPVAYPVSADWAGSNAVHIGSPAEAPPSKIAAFDPSTGILTGLRPGTGELSVTVNGASRRVGFSITP